MFYEGDLNSGIGQALSDSKLVACFVTNDNDESQSWENDFLQEPELKLQLHNKAVLLRLQAGSQEANYLAAIFPTPKVPVLVIIWNGELKEYLASGITKSDFLERLNRVLQAGDDMKQNEGRQFSGTNESSSTEQPTPTGESSAGLSTDEPSPESLATSSQPQESRLDDSKASVEPDTSDHTYEKRGPPTDTTYAATQKKIRQGAKEERARILKLVEDDKVARRAREAERKAQASNETTAKPVNSRGSLSSSTQDCAIQIRLFDGSTIRSKFKNTCTLRDDVRQWIDKQRTDDAPYIFKQVLTPLSNTNLSITDEGLDLESLGLAPSATLIIIPIQAYTSAYEGSSAIGLVSQGLSAGLGLGAWGISQITGTLRNLVSGPPGNLTGDDRHPPGTAAPSTNLRTLRDRHERSEDHQLYNGNTLNFEPRKDDVDNED